MEQRHHFLARLRSAHHSGVSFFLLEEEEDPDDVVDEDEDDTPIVTNILDNHVRGTANAQNARARRKERSRSREAAHRASRKTATPEPMDDEDEQEQSRINECSCLRQVVNLSARGEVLRRAFREGHSHAQLRLDPANQTM